jgi:hypothetical protein
MLKTSDGSGDANSAAGASYLVARLAFRGGRWANLPASISWRPTGLAIANPYRDERRATKQ